MCIHGCVAQCAWMCSAPYETSVSVDSYWRRRDATRDVGAYLWYDTIYDTL